MAHAQKPDFVFLPNGRVHLNRQGASVQSTTGSRVVRISGSNAGYSTFRGSMKSTGYPHHSPVSLSIPLPCVIVYHHISTGQYCIPMHFANVYCILAVQTWLRCAHGKGQLLRKFMGSVLTCTVLGRD